MGLSRTDLVVPEHHSSALNYSQSLSVQKSESISVSFQLNLLSKHSHKVHLKEGKQPNSWTDGGIEVSHLPPPRHTDCLHQSLLRRRRGKKKLDKTSGQQTARGTGNEPCNWKSNTVQENTRRGSQGSETCWLGSLVFLSLFSWYQIETGGIQERFIQN